MQLAHAGDDGLAGLLVGVDLEGRVLLGELLQTHGELVLLGLGLGLDGDVDNGIGEVHGLEDDGMALVAQGLAGRRVLEADGRDDVARGAIVDIMLLVGMHLEDATNALLLAVVGIDDIGTGVQTTRIDAQVGELANVGIGHDLEGQGRERLLVGRLALLLLVGIGIDAGDGRHVERAGQVVDDSIE